MCQYEGPTLLMPADKSQQLLKNLDESRAEAGATAECGPQGECGGVHQHCLGHFALAGGRWAAITSR